MILKGVVKQGMVELPMGHALPEGTIVDVVVERHELPASANDQPTLKKLLDLAGSVKNMPSDFADQHDHYLHGTPKR